MIKATLKEIPEIQLLWQEVFGDPEDFTNRFLAHFGIENCYVSKQNDEITAMAFALPVEVSGVRCEVSEMWYIYACATRPQYRKLGIMAKLLEAVYCEACAKNVAGIFLHAANQSLENYYRKLGFEDFFYRNHCWVYKDRFLFNKAALTNSIHFTSPETYQKKRVRKLENTCFVNWDEDFFRFIHEEKTQFCEYNNTLFSFKTRYNNIIVEELLGDTPQEQIAQLLFEHLPDFDTVHIRLQGNETCCGQMKWCHPLAPKLQSGYFAFAME